jgi:hypothetical protein
VRAASVSSRPRRTFAGSIQFGEPKSTNKTERLSVGVQPVTLDSDGSGKVIVRLKLDVIAAPQLATDERGVQNATERAQLHGALKLISTDASRCEVLRCIRAWLDHVDTKMAERGWFARVREQRRSHARGDRSTIEPGCFKHIVSN